MAVYKNKFFCCNWYAMGKETSFSLGTVTEQTIFDLYTNHVFSAQHYKICSAAKYLIFP